MAATMEDFVTSETEGAEQRLGVYPEAALTGPDSLEELLDSAIPPLLEEPPTDELPSVKPVCEPGTAITAGTSPSRDVRSKLLEGVKARARP